MKDSRLGTYGMVGLLCILAVKLLGLSAIPNDFTTCLLHQNTFWGRFGFLISTVVCGHGISRFMAVLTIQYGRYAPDHAGSKSKPLASAPLRPLAFWLTAATALLPFLFIFSVSTWLALIPVAIARWWMYRFFYKWIQGYTGDCLGAIQQVTEVVFYLSVAIFWQWQIPISQLQF
jgi:adenosylcobinamide-GDP ribazoletransferase